MPLVHQKLIRRADLRANPESLYVFGDNLERWGLGGQAYAMRGESNAVGIPTKRSPAVFLTDDDYDAVLPIWTADFNLLAWALKAGRTVVWPADGIGTGLAALPDRAPNLWKLLEQFKQTLVQYANLD